MKLGILSFGQAERPEAMPDPLPRADQHETLMSARATADRISRGVGTMQADLAARETALAELEAKAADHILVGDYEVGARVVAERAAVGLERQNLSAMVTARGLANDRLIAAESTFKKDLEAAALAELRRLRELLQSHLRAGAEICSQMENLKQEACRRGAGIAIQLAVPQFIGLTGYAVALWENDPAWLPKERGALDPDLLLVRVIAWPNNAPEVQAIQQGELCSIPKSAARRLLNAKIVEVVDPRTLNDLPEIDSDRPGQRLKPVDPAADMQMVRFLVGAQAGPGTFRTSYGIGETASFKADEAAWLVLNQKVAEYAE